MGDVQLLYAIATSSLTCMLDLVPQGRTNIVWAFAPFAVADRPLLTSISSAARPRIYEFIPQDLSNTAWAFSALVFPPAGGWFLDAACRLPVVLGGAIGIDLVEFGNALCERPWEAMWRTPGSR